MLCPSSELQAIYQDCSEADLKSLKLLITDNQAISEILHEDFVKKFGISPLQSLSVSALGSVVLMNLANMEVGKRADKGSKRGSVGRAIPGVAAKIVDPVIGKQRLAADTVGQLMIKSPSIF